MVSVGNFRDDWGIINTCRQAISIDDVSTAVNYVRRKRLNPFFPLTLVLAQPSAPLP